MFKLRPEASAAIMVARDMGRVGDTAVSVDILESGVCSGRRREKRKRSRYPASVRLVCNERPSVEPIYGRARN